MNSNATKNASDSGFARLLGLVWIDALLGLFIGLAGGLLAKWTLISWTASDLIISALFGSLFGLFFAKRATSPGAGLIWGIGSAFFLWLVIPAGFEPLLSGFGESRSMLGNGIILRSIRRSGCRSSRRTIRRSNAGSPLQWRLAVGPGNVAAVWGTARIPRWIL